MIPEISTRLVVGVVAIRCRAVRAVWSVPRAEPIPSEQCSVASEWAREGLGSVSVRRGSAQ